MPLTMLNARKRLASPATDSAGRHGYSASAATAPACVVHTVLSSGVD